MTTSRPRTRPTWAEITGDYAWHALRCWWGDEASHVSRAYDCHLAGWWRKATMATATADPERHRYYITIQTQPHGLWLAPVGWTAETLADARAMLRRASDQWMRARLWDGQTGLAVVG